MSSSDRLLSILEKCADAAKKSGRNKDAVQLVAVSKTKSAEDVLNLYNAWPASSLSIFGENYVQESLEKKEAVQQLIAEQAMAEQAMAEQLAGKIPSNKQAPEWHFIGHIQSRKAKDVLGQFSLIHSVDSIKLAQKLNLAQINFLQEQEKQKKTEECEIKHQKKQAILLQINIGREEQKSGILLEDVEKVLLELQNCENLVVQGLMCLPPVLDAGEKARPYFAQLRELRDNLQVKTGLQLPHLSMGMSSDYEVAIEEGATIVRVGSLLFGARPAK